MSDSTNQRTHLDENTTVGQSSLHHDSIIGEQEYFNNNLFDNESIKSNSFENNINAQEKEEQLKHNNISKKHSTHLNLDNLIYYIICKSCQSFFLIKFLNYNYMTIKCKCSLIKNINPIEFASLHCSNTSIYSKKENFDKKKFKKYIKYCMECKKDLDEESLKDIAMPNNENGKITAHETHHLIDLFNNKKDIKILNDCLYKIKEDSPQNRKAIKSILSNLIKDYKNYPNYYAYKTIKNAAEFLSKEILPCPKEPLKLVKLKIINSFKNLEKNLDYTNSFYKIEIDGRETHEMIESLDILKNKQFKELEKFEIKNVQKLTDISALKTCSFQNLKKLFISDEDINNDCIDVIKNLKAPKINFISLYNNKITSPEIFDSTKNLNTLEKFYIGCNKLNLNELPNKDKKYYFPPNLTELGISFNFTTETNYFITNNLNIENIKKLYVNGNGLTSLKIFNNYPFKQLEYFWAKGDKEKGYLENIEEINNLKNNKNLKKIVFKQNNIRNIEKLVDIIPNFPNLEFLDLRDNEIPRNQIQTVLNKIKEKGFDKLIIRHNYY